MQTQAVLYLGVCILSFFCIISLPVSGNQMHEKCQEASTLINNLTATTPRDDDGCVMKFQTKRGICCLIGIKLNQREHFKGRYFIDNQCFKFKCLYNGKKRKWEKCKCRKNKVKLPKRRPKPSPTTKKPTTTTQKPKPTTQKPTPKPTTQKPKPLPTTQKPIPKPTTQKPKPITQKPISTTKKPESRPVSMESPTYGCPVPGSDVIYPPGMEIPELKTKSGQKCLSAYCGENGVIKYTEEDCVESNVPHKPPTTTKKPNSRPITAPPLPPGCTAPGSGNFYPPGVEIAELKTRSGHRCVSAFCGKDGVIKYTEDDCFDPMDFTTQPLLGTTPPFHFTTLTPGEE